MNPWRTAAALLAALAAYAITDFWLDRLDFGLLSPLLPLLSVFVALWGVEKWFTRPDPHADLGEH